MPDGNYYLGEWKVEPGLQRISKNGKTVKLEPQLMEVLQLLAGNPGQVITKDRLRSTVWSDVVITENVITRSISSLRKLLEDDPAKPLYIETISKKGYRLIAEVRIENPKGTKNTFTIKLAVKPVILTVTAILFLVAGAFAIRQVFLPTTANNAFHPLAISNSTTTEYWPAISPDGRFVAYGWKGHSNDNWDIYARLIGTETVLRLTNNSATDLRAKWSGDGNYVYYLRYENGGSTIYKKPIVGGNEIRVISSPPYSSGDFDVSNDGKWISFNTRTNKDSPLSIVRISLESGESIKLTSPPEGTNGDIHPRFSPDGKRIAFIREKNPASMFLYIFDIQKNILDQVSEDPVSINGFDWSQDGQSLIYSSDKYGVYKLYELDPDTRKSLVLKSGDYQMVMPRVSSTGRIIYAKMRDNVNIWSYNLESQEASTWFATNELNLNPVPSPDGSKVCFTKQKQGRFELWVADAGNSSDAIPITSFPGQYVTSPRWSPDGKSLYFQGYSDGQSDIFLVDAKGGVSVNLTESDSDEHTPFPIGNEVYFSSSKESGEWNIWKMDSKGKNISKVADYEGYAPQLSSDHSMLYYLKKSTTGIWQFDLEDQVETLLIPFFHPMYQGAFAVVDRGIYYYHAKNKRFEYFDFETQESKVIYQPQRRIPRLGITLSVFPNNQLILFSQVDENDADIMLLEEQVN